VRVILSVLLLAAAGLAVLLASPSQASATLRPSGPVTSVVVVRPVRADGTPVPGWIVHRERGRAFCDAASPAAVRPGIVSCSPSAAYLPACWRSGHHTVLCLRDPSVHELVRMRYAGRFPQVAKPAVASPLAMRLFDGASCQIRVGGAWGVPPDHPHWVGFYSCDVGGDIYGPRADDGIIRTRPLWWVRQLDDGLKDVHHRAVRTAYLVGTAG
jgi:hypothetical protein